MTTLQQATTDAVRVMKANNMPFVTIWKTGKSFGFNFERQEIGYTKKEYGVKRIVINVVNN